MVTESSLRAYEEGAIPRIDALVAIAKAAGVNLSWLATGEGSRHVGESDDCQCSSEHAIVANNQPFHDDLHDDFVYVKGYSDVAAAAGHGAFVGQEDSDRQFAFRRLWAVVEMGLEPELAAVIRVEGDSMSPTLAPGDSILLDLRETRFARDAVYVFSWDDGLFVKRIHRTGRSSFRAMSDNPLYPPMEFDQSNVNELCVVGRVVWAGRRM